MLFTFIWISGGGLSRRPLFPLLHTKCSRTCRSARKPSPGGFHVVIPRKVRPGKVDINLGRPLAPVSASNSIRPLSDLKERKNSKGSNCRVKGDLIIFIIRSRLMDEILLFGFSIDGELFFCIFRWMVFIVFDVSGKDPGNWQGGQFVICNRCKITFFNKKTFYQLKKNDFKSSGWWAITLTFDPPLKRKIFYSHNLLKAEYWKLFAKWEFMIISKYNFHVNISL